MMENMWSYEREVIEAGFSPVCGIDEAGRGPFAGPVFAAAVILPFGVDISGLDDSKKLSPKKRDELYDIIINTALAFCVASASVAEIEEHNILHATMLAMRRAADGLSIKPGILLIDGDKQFGFTAPTRCIIGGDGKSASVAAASILAKVERDRLMESLALEYPEYSFEKHKGYGTPLHMAAIRKYGPCPVHRPSFLRKMGREAKEA